MDNLLTVQNRFDLQKWEIARLKNVIENFTDINSDILLEKGLLYKKQSKAIRLDMERIRKELKDPYLQMWKEIDRLCKEAVAPVKELESMIWEKIIAYEEVKQKEREEQIRLERERLAKIEQEKIEVKARLMQEAKDFDPVVDEEAIYNQIRTDFAEVIDEPVEIKDVKIRWFKVLQKFEIIDEDEVPRKFCSPDDKKIREYIKGTTIDDDEVIWKGIRFYKEKKIN